MPIHLYQLTKQKQNLLIWLIMLQMSRLALKKDQRKRRKTTKIQPHSNSKWMKLPNAKMMCILILEQNMSNLFPGQLNCNPTSMVEKVNIYIFLKRMSFRIFIYVFLKMFCSLWLWLLGNGGSAKLHICYVIGLGKSIFLLHQSGVADLWFI